MRFLFALLLILNLGFFAYSLFFKPDDGSANKQTQVLAENSPLKISLYDELEKSGAVSHTPVSSSGVQKKEAVLKQNEGPVSIVAKTTPTNTPIVIAPTSRPEATNLVELAAVSATLKDKDNRLENKAETNDSYLVDSSKQENEIKHDEEEISHLFEQLDNKSKEIISKQKDQLESNQVKNSVASSNNKAELKRTLELPLNSNDPEEENSTDPSIGREQANGQKTALCFSIGPTQYPKKLEQLKRTIAQTTPSEISDLSFENYQLQGGSNYRIYVPPLKNANEIQAVIAKLKANKINDYYIMKAPGRENAIALGVFTLKRIADNLASQVERLGYPAVVEELYEENKVQYFLRVSLLSLNHLFKLDRKMLNTDLKISACKKSEKKLN